MFLCTLYQSEIILIDKKATLSIFCYFRFERIADGGGIEFSNRLNTEYALKQASNGQNLAPPQIGLFE